MSDDPHIKSYLAQTITAIRRLDPTQIDGVVRELRRVRVRNGRLFFLGCGGGAAHASHAVNDARKLAGLEAYAATDNVAELTARVNDDGWATSYVEWLRASRLNRADLVFVFSVGGGDIDRKVSLNLVRALEYSSSIGARSCAIVGRIDGFAAHRATACVTIPTVDEKLRTPNTEGLQSVVWHLLISHPDVQRHPAKWESLG